MKGKSSTADRFVIYVAENFNGDDTDDLLRPVKQWQARQESKDLSKVTIRGQVSLSEEGWWNGGVPPFGYDLLYHDSNGKPYMIVRFTKDCEKEILDLEGRRQRLLQRRDSIAVSKKDHAKLVPSSADRVALVRRIFNMYAGGAGFRAIADQLNAEAISSPRTSEWANIHDGRWSSSTIREIIINPNYFGDGVWNRRTMAKFHRVSNKSAVARSACTRNRLEANPTEDWIVEPNNHEGLIERSLRDQCQQIRNKRENRSQPSGFRGGRAKTSPYMLSGVIRCGRCGHSLQGFTVTKGKRKKDGEKVRTSYYMCGGYVAKGNSVCKRVLYRQDALDKLVLDEIGARLRSYLSADGLSILQRLVRETVSQPVRNTERDVQDVRDRLRQIEAKADEFLEMMTPTNREFIDEKLARMKKERQALEVRLGELQAVREQAVDCDQLAEEITAELRRYEQALAGADLVERKAFVRAFVKEVLLSPDAGDGVVRIRKFPLPASARNGNFVFWYGSGGRI